MKSFVFEGRQINVVFLSYKSARFIRRTRYMPIFLLEPRSYVRWCLVPVTIIYRHSHHRVLGLTGTRRIIAILWEGECSEQSIES